MSLDVVETLCELVKRPSVNPMGRPADGDEFYEYHVTEYLQQVFQQLDVPWFRQTVAPRRDNIFALLEGDPPLDAGGPLLMFEAHQDTVPVVGMTIPPWTPEHRQGRIYGRGACDIKGGMACMLAVLARLNDERPAGRPSLLIACTVNEEHGFTGAQQVSRIWEDPAIPLLSRRPDAAIVAEPTLLDVVVAHKGTVRWQLSTRGRAAHSSRPELGENAIYAMAPVLAALQRYAKHVAVEQGEHPLVGSASLSVGRISGGTSVNTVPDHCAIEIDRRLVPSESPSKAWQDAKTWLADQLQGKIAIEHSEPMLSSAGLSDDANGDLADRLSRIARPIAPGCRKAGVPYGTNAPCYAEAGIPTVVFGPGSIEQAHTADEWVAVDQLHAATEILYRFATV